MITRDFKLYLNAGVGVAPVINANQFDKSEEWVFTLLQSDGTVYTPSTGAIIGLKQDGTTILNAGTVNEDGQVVITETEQMTAVPGSNLFEILIDGNTHGTANFVVFVERRPGDIDNPSESDISLFQEAITAAGNVTQFQADISALQSGLSQETQTRQAQDTSLASQIAQEASTRSQQDAVLQAEIDQIIAPSGEAPSAAEVQNARIGVDGTTYDTLGNAIRGQVSDLKNAINDLTDEIADNNCIEFISLMDKVTETVAGITYTWSEDSCTVTGSNSAISFTAMFLSKTSFPRGMKAGGTYYLKYSGTNVQFRIYYYESADSSAIQLFNSLTDKEFTIPQSATGVQIRLHVPAGNTVSETVNPRILNTLSNEDITNRLSTGNLPLVPTGDTTDVSSVIEGMLTDTGVCHLGQGDFYVSGIDMPANTKIDGCGAKTRIILLGNNTDEGYAIKLADNCYVESLTVLGNATNISVSSLTSTVVNRHGILFKANYDTDQSTILRCFVKNVRIANFTGGGIACINTGYSTWSCVGVTDCYIYRCTAGIYVPYWSEFHRFTGVHCTQCYYGAVNNGGNCTFVGCNFCSNIIGMIMDNSSDQSPNNSHGGVIGCIFDHEDNNNGIGIKIDGCQNGEIFSDCQLFYADIEVNNSKGIQFNHFNIGGSGNEITVTKSADGGSVIFNGCIFKDDSYTISVSSGYDACRFINCFTRDGETVTA